MGIFKRNKPVEIKESELMELLQGDIQANDLALKWITLNWKAEALAFIRSKNVPEHEVEDVFFTALDKLNEKVRLGKLEDALKIRQYFNSICHNEAVDYRNKRSAAIKLFLPIDPVVENQKPDDAVDLLHLSAEIVALYYELIRNLGEQCRRLLAFRGVEFSFAEIATIMGFPNQRAAINRAYDCRGELRRLAENNPAIMHKIKALL